MHEVGAKQLEWLKEELRLNGFIDTPVGKNLIAYYESCLEMSNADQFVMEHFRALTDRTFAGLPLSPLNGGDEMVETLDQNGDKTLRNKRYDPVCSEINRDDIFFDDKAVTFIIDGVKTWLYQGDESERSRKAIVFPYYPVENIQYK